MSVATNRAGRLAATALCVALGVAACGSSANKPTTATTTAVDAAQKRVNAAQQAATSAQKAYDTVAAAFCTNTKTYISAIDRYGKLFDDSKATVGDLKTMGADLVQPRSVVASSTEAVTKAREDLAAAKKELADAQAALVAAQSGATATTAAPPATTTTTLVAQATVDRINRAEADFTAATHGVADNTTLAQATVQVNSAAFALEVAWLRVLLDAGCLTEEQQHEAAQALVDYTTALQGALQRTGAYTGEIDGIYGPATVDAVKKLQSASGLPQTGYVDRATALALQSAVVAKESSATAAAIAATAAVQSALKIAGYWTGPVDGTWTPELTDALKKFQTALGVPATGVVDTATLAALETSIAAAKTATSTTTTSTPAATTTAPATTTT